MQPEKRKPINHSKPLVLIVEDDLLQAQALASALIRRDMGIRICTNAGSAYRLVVQQSPDLIVLDINLQRDGDGFKLLEKIRAISRAPVIILTGRRLDPQDVARAAAGKATTYLHKLLAPPEVVAGFVQEQLVSLGKVWVNTLRLGELCLDVATQKVTYNESQLTLTPMLARVLICLMEAPGGRKKSDWIARRIYNADDEYAVISVRTHVNRLRTRLEKLSPEISISGRRNYGYGVCANGVLLTTDAELLHENA